jgi:hypothetical protein
MQKKKNDFIGIILIIFAMGVISYVTFAWMTYNIKGNSTLNFGKIELDSNIPTINVSRELNNLLPNDNIINGVSFKKSLNSESFFVRANANFSCNISSEESDNYIKILDDDIKNYVTMDWYFYNDYYYLVDNGNLKIISDENEYTFIEGYKASKELLQWSNVSQYDVVFNFNVKFNVIQSSNIELSSLQEGINFFVSNFKDNLLTSVNKISCTIERNGVDTQSNLIVGDNLYNSLSLTDKNIVIVNNTQIDNNKVIDEDLNGSVIEIYDYTDEKYFVSEEITLNGKNTYGIRLKETFSDDVLVLPNVVGGNICTVVMSTYNGSNHPFNSLNIKTLIVPNGYTKIEEYTFMNNSNLQKIYFSNVLDNLDTYCFSSCTKLNNIIIPDSISIISRSAFQDCSNLSYVTFNKTQVLKSYSFYGTKLASVIVPKTALAYDNTVGHYFPDSCSINYYE